MHSTIIATAKTNFDDKESRWLSKKAPIILIANVLRIDQTPNHSTITLQAGDILKGATHIPDSLIRIHIQSGSVLVDPSKPQFSRNERCVLFLNKNNNDGALEIIEGRIGKKVIINENVYLDEAQSHMSLKLKDYLKLVHESKEEIAP